MDDIKNSKASFNIVPITDNDKQIVQNSLRKYFLRDAPLTVSIGLSEEKESIIQYDNFWADILKRGLSFMAISAETGEMMGVALNSTVFRSDEIEQYGDENKSSKYNDIMVLFDKARRESDVFGKYPHVDRILAIKCITVNEECRGLGICKALIDKSKELALKLGCQLMYGECSSHYSAKAADRVGFQCIYSLSYSDHVNKQGEVIFKTQPPHKYLTIYMTLL